MFAVVIALSASVACALEIETNAAGEGQAFANNIAEYGQGVALQRVEECGYTTVNSKEKEFELSGYGSVNLQPAMLVFGAVAGKFTETTTYTDSHFKLEAKIEQMSGYVDMQSNAGASAAASTFVNIVVPCDPTVVSQAAAGQTLHQAQFKPYEGGGYGTQCYTGTTSASVNAIAAIP